LIVNGAYRGEEAILESIDEKKFSCSVTIANVSIYIYFLFICDQNNYPCMSAPHTCFFFAESEGIHGHILQFF
jgi:hypothetical protein